MFTQRTLTNVCARVGLRLIIAFKWSMNHYFTNMISLFMSVLIYVWSQVYALDKQLPVDTSTAAYVGFSNERGQQIVWCNIFFLLS